MARKRWERIYLIVTMFAYYVKNLSRFCLVEMDFLLDVEKILAKNCPHWVKGKLFVEQGFYPFTVYLQALPAHQRLAYIHILEMRKRAKFCCCGSSLFGEFTNHPATLADLFFIFDAEFLKGCNVTHSHLDLASLKHEGDFSSMPVPGYVYLIQNAETKSLKIGAAGRTESRVSELQVGSDAELIVLARYFTNDKFGEEAYLHRRFEKHWKRGDWFFLDPEILNYFEEKSRG